MLAKGYRFWGRPYRFPWFWHVLCKNVPRLDKVVFVCFVRGSYIYVCRTHKKERFKQSSNNAIWLGSNIKTHGSIVQQRLTSKKRGKRNNSLERSSCESSVVGSKCSESSFPNTRWLYQLKSQVLRPFGGQNGKLCLFETQPSRTQPSVSRKSGAVVNDTESNILFMGTPD